MLPTQTIPDQQLQQQQESQQSQQSQDRQYQPQQPFQQQQQIILYQQQQQQQQQLQQQQEYKKPKTANYKIRSYSSQEQHDQAQIRQGGQTVFTNKVLSQAYRPLNGIQKRESSFVLDCQRFSNIEHEIYDPLKDGHLGSFFSNKRNKELLYRHKVLKRKGNNSNILPRDNNILRSPKNKTQNNLTFNGSLMLDQDIHQNDLSNNAHRRLPRLEKYFVHNNLRSNSQQVEGVTKEERVLGSQSQFEERQNIYGKYDYDEHQGELLKQPQQGYIQSQGEQYSFIEGAQRKAEMTAISGKQVFSQKQIEQQKQLQLLKARKEDSKDKQIIKQDTIDGKVDNKTAGTSQSSSCSANIILSPASSNNNNNTNHNNSKRLSRSKRGKSESNQRTIKNNYLIKPSQPPNNSPMNQQNYQQQQQNKQDHQNNEIIIQPHQIDLNNNNNTTNHIKINNNIYNSPFLQGNSYGNSKGVYGYLVQQQNQIIKSAQQQQALIQAIQKNGMNQKTKQQKSPEKLQKDNEQVQATKLSGNNTVEQINADQEQQNQQQSKQTVKSENNHTNNDDQNINTNNINTINQSNNQKIIIAPTSAIIQPQSQQQQQQQSRQLLNQKHSQHYSQSKSYRPSNNTTATSPGLMDIYSKIEVLPYSPKNLNTNSNFKYPKQPRTLKRKELPQLNKEQFVSFLEKFKSKCAIFQPSQSTLPLSQLNNQESSMSQFNQPISNQIQQHTEQVQLNQPQITQIQKGTL